MSVSPNGLAHVQYTISCKHWDESARFFKQWLGTCFGMTLIMDNAGVFYHVGGRCGILFTKCGEEFDGERFDQRRIGLHHTCFRMRSNEDVEKTHAFLVAFNKEQQQRGKPQLNILRGPEAGVWAPGYYSILFEDFDGIRWEANHVPAKGWLDPSRKPPGQSVPPSFELGTPAKL